MKKPRRHPAPDEQWHPPLVEFHQFALSVSAGEEEALQQRLDSLTPLLTQIERVIPAVPSGASPQVDGAMVRHILRTFFPPQEDPTVHISPLRRAVQKIHRDREFLPFPYREALEQAEKELREELTFWQRAARRHSCKCPFVSEALTALALYFRECLPTRPASDAYKLAGAIMTAFSYPVCLICRTVHKFPDWRNVRARDLLKRE